MGEWTIDGDGDLRWDVDRYGPDSGLRFAAPWLEAEDVWLSFKNCGPEFGDTRIEEAVEAYNALRRDVRKARRFDEAEKLILRLDTLTDRKKIDYGLVAALVKLWEGEK